MNEQSHPTTTALSDAAQGRLTQRGPDRSGSCSFDVYPIDMPIDRDNAPAESGNCAVAEAQGLPQSGGRPQLATDFIDLLIRKPGAAPPSHPSSVNARPSSAQAHKARANAALMSPSISPVVSRTSPSSPPVSAPETTPESPAEPLRRSDRRSNRDLLLQLPKLKAAKLSNHRFRSNPALSLGILEDIGRVVNQWRDEIDDIHRQIQALYAEGPILEAWLESAQGSAPPSRVVPEEAQVSAVQPVDQGADANFNDGCSGQFQVSIDAEPGPSRTPADHKTYWLCGLDDDGQLWRHHCSPRDLAPVTMAIARYQNQRQLMNRKHHLEQRLNQLAKTLTVLRGRLRA